jgi:hypothetical protein
VTNFWHEIQTLFVTTSVVFNNNLYFDLDINRLDTARPNVNGHNKRTLSEQLRIDNSERVANELRRLGEVQRQRQALQSRLNFTLVRVRKQPLQLGQLRTMITLSKWDNLKQFPPK